MRVSRLYIDLDLIGGATLALPAESAHYLGTVLRAREGDAVLLFNARDGEFEATVTASKKGKVDVELGARVRAPLPSLGGDPSLSDTQLQQTPSLRLHLALGLSRGDRMDYAIQKATELGVDEITPLFTEHGEVRLKPERLENKLRHFEKIAINASEQCGRLDVPTLNPPLTLTEFLQRESTATRLLLEPSAQERLPAEPRLSSVELIIGPEGGFSAAEIQLANENACRAMRLGPRVLRTETAPVAALAVLQFLFGDLS